MRDIDKHCDCDKYNIAVTHDICCFSLQIEIRKCKHMVSHQHYHDFIENLQFNSNMSLMWPCACIEHDVEGCEQDVELQLDERKVVAHTRDQYKKKTSRHEDRVKVFVSLVSIEMYAFV